MSRRAVIGGGVVVVAAGAVGAGAATHRLDDALDAVGVRPTPLPDDADLAVVSRARSDAVALLAAARDREAPEAVVTALQAHVDALPGTSPAVTAPRRLAAGLEAAAKARALDAEEARAPELSVVLASMSVSLSQCARVVAR